MRLALCRQGPICQAARLPLVRTFAGPVRPAPPNRWGRVGCFYRREDNNAFLDYWEDPSGPLSEGREVHFPFVPPS